MHVHKKPFVQYVINVKSSSWRSTFDLNIHRDIIIDFDDIIARFNKNKIKTEFSSYTFHKNYNIIKLFSDILLFVL